MNALEQSLKLPCGSVLKNRIAKAAMTERLADRYNNASDSLIALYKFWSETGSGLLISGNIMIDSRYKESGGNIVLEDESGQKELQEMVKAGTKNGTQFWAQINHPGRQATIFSTFSPIAPSAVKLKKLMLFAKPSAMTIDQIKEVEKRFINTAELCKKAGFTGIQFHSAHGYLLSQFLSPNTNVRQDIYGGNIENRARLLFDIIRGAREKLGDNYPISVKLNSADFQRGGFTEEDSLFVIKELEKLNIDLLEISGGTYENVTFFKKHPERESTKQREAYFLDFAKKIRSESNIPLMITGGFRSKSFCSEVLNNNELDVIGFARPYLNEINFPKIFLNGEKDRISDAHFDLKFKSLKDFAEAGFYDYQISRIANGDNLIPDFSPYLSILRLIKNEVKKGWFN